MMKGRSNFSEGRDLLQGSLSEKIPFTSMLRHTSMLCSIHYLFHILHITDCKLLMYAMNIEKDKYKIILL